MTPASSAAERVIEAAKRLRERWKADWTPEQYAAAREDLFAAVDALDAAPPEPSLCERAMSRLQSWLVDNHKGRFDVSTAESVVAAMIELSAQPETAGAEPKADEWDLRAAQALLAKKWDDLEARIEALESSGAREGDDIDVRVQHETLFTGASIKAAARRAAIEECIDWCAGHGYSAVVDDLRAILDPHRA